MYCIIRTNYALCSGSLTVPRADKSISKLLLLLTVCGEVSALYPALAFSNLCMTYSVHMVCRKLDYSFGSLRVFHAESADKIYTVTCHHCSSNVNMSALSKYLTYFCMREIGLIICHELHRYFESSVLPTC